MPSGTMNNLDPTGTSFTTALERLKRDGSSVLVVGSVGERQRQHVTSRLLGDDAEQQRRRILVTTTGEGIDEHIHQANSVDETTIIQYDGDGVTRGTTVAPSVFTSPTSPPSPSDTDEATHPDTLGDIGIAISNAIDAFDDEALEPGTLRIGVDSLLPLLERYGREAVFQFVHLLNGRVKAANGMIHYHVPAAHDALIVSVLEPLFDITVVLREHDEAWQEQWILDDDHTSGWIPTEHL
ncbi:DUF7504 family protein [Natronosalvus vescus]|uniref:DUF7504 family protein n=1 Tax=Natronosalvus vescus TaxID=2953881 RepID=UPI00209009A5|nr:hypothetical protein [Natronosalvus vescus]